MTRNRRIPIRVVRTLVVALAASTALGVVTLAAIDACYEATQMLRVVLLTLPLLLFVALVILGAATSEHKREPWFAFGVAGTVLLGYLPFAFFIFLWDTGC